MVLQEIFEVIIGLMLIWLVLNTATTQFSEQRLTRPFHDHLLIRSLTAARESLDARPLYIPAKEFSTALLNLMQNADTESLRSQGSSYWFDVSAQIIYIRGAGIRPA